MRKLICVLCLVFSIILCSCSVQKSTVILNQEESNSMDRVYDIHCFQNEKINIVIYEYLNGKWNKIISEFLESETQKIILTLVTPQSQENDYHFQISYKDNLDENMKQLQKIVFKESGSFFHQKGISQIEKNKELQNLAIYEWSNDGEVCIYDLKNFSINDSYNAKRAYLVMIDLYDETN